MHAVNRCLCVPSLSIVFKCYNLVIVTVKTVELYIDHLRDIDPMFNSYFIKSSIGIFAIFGPGEFCIGYIKYNFD